MSDKKIIMMGPSLDGLGGISSVVNTYIQAGLFDQWDILYFPTHRKGSTIEKLYLASSSFIKFFILLLKQEISILHIHTASRKSFFRKSIFAFVARKLGVRYILHLHGGEFNTFYEHECGALMKIYVNKIFRDSEYVIALSESWKDWLEGNVKTNKVVRIYNPVIMPRTDDIKNKKDGCTILFLGWLVQRKGIYDLLKAVSILAEKFPDLRVMVGGDGELEIVTAKIKAYHVEENVKILGWVTGEVKYKLLSQSSIFVLPSYTEGLPIGILEAMSFGLPVVSTPVGGITEAVHDGKEGFIIQPGDVDGLVSALDTLLSDVKKQELMGSAAFDAAMNIFSADKIVEQISCIYRKMGMASKNDYGYAGS